MTQTEPNSTDLQNVGMLGPSPFEEREAQFPQFIEQTLLPFWQSKAQAGWFSNRQHIAIHYVHLDNPNADTAVVVSPGRIEGYLKYQELAYDLFQQGYSVFILDHQGQGLSSRRLNNWHKGYVEDFQHYVDDLADFIECYVRPRHSGNLHLLAHSMGGAIGLRYLQQFPDTFAKASFSSPMWGFRSGRVPEFIAKGLVDLGHWVSDTVSRESAYFIGGKDYETKPFEGNELTHSQARYQYFRDIYNDNPKLQLGGITFAWLNASIAALEQAYKDLDKVVIPIQVLQAEGETVIDNEAQDRFCQRLATLGMPCFNGKPFIVAGARHELLFETDVRRSYALRRIFEYFCD